jgi:hypothetical protein
VSFINPWFLAAMGTALLPVLYHLVRRMRADKVRFSSLMFLRKTPKELVRKRRLRDWLLLLLRALIFALLALAFARPFLPEEHIPFTEPAANRSTILLLDNSYSMQYGDRFETARSEALARIDRASAQDELSVVTFSDQVEQLTALETDLSIHRAALQNTARSTHRSTNFHNPLRRAEEILADARYDSRRIVLISDFQNIGWTEPIEDWKLASDLEFVPVKIGSSAPENTYVETVELTQRRRGSQVIVQFGGRIERHTPTTPGESTIQLSIDGNPIDEQTTTTSLPATVRFQQDVTNPGQYQGTITADGSDPLPVDDQYYFTYTVDPQPSILAVDGSSAQTTGDAFFLEQAFDVGEEALFTFSTTGPSGLVNESLGTYDVVFLMNLPQISDMQADRLQSYLENGGSVIMSFGEQTVATNLSETLKRLNIGTLAENTPSATSPSQAHVIGQIDTSHPIFDVFSESSTSPIFRSNFRRYLRLQPDSTARVLARYNNGDPMLVEQASGAGKVLVYTSSLSTAWTDFPISESFVPLLYQLARYAARGSNPQHTYRIGDRVPLSGSPGDEWEIRAPDETIHSVTIETPGTGYFAETNIPGHYVAARANEQFRFSVNLDTRESNLESRDQEEAYAAVVPSTEQQLSSRKQQAAAIEMTDEEHEQKLWRTILLIVIGLFAIETIVANRRLGLRNSSRATN